MSERYDALVIGSGVGGLAATALLGKAGLRTLLLERSAILFESDGEATLHALDPRLVKALRLPKRGLKFATRDLALRTGPLAITRDRHATARSLGPVDGEAYALYRGELLALARALRPLWWDGGATTLKPAQRALLERLSVTSASAWLAAWFESDALKAALAFDAAICGAAPSEPGSALALVWSAAQEMSGRQDATALPVGGVAGLLKALSEAAQASGAEIRTAATVSRLVVADGAVSGVELAAGEAIAAPLVLSALSRRRTLTELTSPAVLGLGAARALARPVEEICDATLAYALKTPAALDAASRLVIAEKLEIYEAALGQLRLGLVPDEPALELVAAEGRVVARAWPCAASFDRDDLVRKVSAMIDRHLPGFAAGIATCDVLEPRVTAPVTVARLLAPAAERIETPIPGLLLCGTDAEPANALSGVAARHAARIAVALHKKARRS